MKLTRIPGDMIPRVSQDGHTPVTGPAPKVGYIVDGFRHLIVHAIPGQREWTVTHVGTGGIALPPLWRDRTKAGCVRFVVIVATLGERWAFSRSNYNEGPEPRETLQAAVALCVDEIARVSTSTTTLGPLAE